MALYVDKHRPSSLDKLDYHASLTDQLRKMAASPDFPHLLVYGPSGAGKKTRIMAVLKEIYGQTVEKLKIDQRTFLTPSNKKIEINIVSSNYHMEITPSDVGSNDRLVIQELIKEVAQTQQVDSSAKRSFKVVILNEADTLSKDAQHALRRTMEKYMTNLRVILCTNSTSRIIGPIRSRCLLVRVAAPSTDEILQVMTKVAIKEGIHIPDAFGTKIAEMSGGNLRKALLMLETAKVKHYPFSNDHPIPLTDWENYIKETAKLIVAEQTPKRLQDIRGRLYELLCHCIAPEVILKTLMFDIIKLVDVGIVPEIVKMAADYEQSMRLGSKPIFHLEAFVAKFMALYKRFLFELMQ
ncbi:P-loop containing nucleoside triphosphate hydrolase protein [Rhizoclosmatium globosum]|uniref:Replication factor C subunit 5 n=1 Tax=Rhizoclosmatium globosum TaxID=329046 RepID=A0A1Y2B6N6_9FUNG|nr:P-loop containing nucleoside triphosphate hydrolase protein [Rhizoclosmatium globosum]|eukprot:ORY30501.1 P-loop containing nucleoside triphosphate hydrolase protein [Rhizoclosmatium globosum]